MHSIRSPRFATVSAGLAFAFTLAAHCVQAAPILAVSQARSVAATVSASVPGNSDNDADAATAPDFSPFNGSIAPSASALLATSGQSAGATGTATQVSTLGTGAVSAASTVQAQLGLTAGANGAAAANPTSVFEFVFDIIETSNYALTGSVDTQAVLIGGADLPTALNDLLFENITTSTTLFQALTNDEAFSLSGILNPGRYRLSASASVDASQVSNAANAMSVNATSAYSFTLDVTTSPVPEPASLALVLMALALMGMASVRTGARPLARFRESVAPRSEPASMVR